MKRVKKSATRIAYEKEVRRIKAFIKSAEKRGYNFDKSYVNQVLAKPKRYTKKQVERLKEIKPITLYKRATAISESGKRVKGTEKIKEERHISAVKRVAKRVPKVKTIDIGEIDITTIPIDDITDIGNYALNRVWEMIDETIESGKGWGGKYLAEVLTREIATYGEDKVEEALEQAPEDIIAMCEVVSFASHSEEVKSNIRAIHHLITGAMPSAEDEKELNRVFELDDFVDFELF